MVPRLIPLLAIVLVSCASPDAPLSDPRQVWCDSNDPRRPSEAAVLAMSREELDHLNAHNLKGQRWCGWKP